MNEHVFEINLPESPSVVEASKAASKTTDSLGRVWEWLGVVAEDDNHWRYWEWKGRVVAP